MNMKITENTLITFPGKIGVEPGMTMFFNNINEASEMRGVSPRSIKRAIKEESCDRHGYQWYNAIELILDARGMIEVKIKTQEWFDEVFKDIENLDEIR